MNLRIATKVACTIATSAALVCMMGIPAAVASNSPMTVTVGQATFDSDGVATVPVSINDCPGIASFAFDVAYDKSKMTLSSITSKNSVVNATLTANVDNGVVSWYYTSNQTLQGEVLLLTFKTGNADELTGSTVTLSPRNNDAGNISNSAGDTVDTAYASGYALSEACASGAHDWSTWDLTSSPSSLADGQMKRVCKDCDAAAIESLKIGDVDANGSVDVRDVVALQRGLAKITTLSLISEAAADMDGSGDVAMNDLLKLAKTMLD